METTKVEAQRIDVIAEATESGQAWFLLIRLFLVVLVSWGAGYNTFGVLFAPLMKEFSWNHTDVALLSTALALSMAIFNFIAGWAVEHTTPQAVMVCGILTMATAYFWASVANSFVPIMGAFALSGAGLALASIVPANFLVSKWFDKHRGLAIGISTSGAAAGGFVVVPLSAHLVSSFGWRESVFMLAGLMLVTAIPLLLWGVKEPRGPAHAEKSARNEDPPGLEVTAGLRSGAFWLILIPYLLYTFSLAIPLVHVIPYLITLGYRPERAAMVFSLKQGVALAGCITFGFFGDKIAGKKIVAFGLLSSAAGLFALLGAAYVGWVVFFIFAFGISAAGTGATTYLLLSEAVGVRHFGVFSGILVFAGMLALAAGPFVGGHIIDLTASYYGAFELGSVCAMLGALMILMIPKPRFERLENS